MSSTDHAYPSPQAMVGLFLVMLLLQWPAAILLHKGHFWGGILFGQCITLALPAVLVSKWQGYRWSQIAPLRMAPAVHIMAVVALTMCITWSTEHGIAWLKLHWTMPELFEERFADKLIWGSTWHNIALIAGLAILPAIIEEAYFRGLCYAAFAKPFGAPAAILASSLFFAFAHGSTIYFPIYFLLGCYLGYLRKASGHLLLPIIAHSINNITTLALKNL